MKNLKRYWAFWIPYFLFLIVLLTLIIVNEKAELHLWFNSNHTPWQDVFFRYYTQVGEWVPFVVCAGLLFYRFRAALLMLSAQIAAGLVTQIFKRIFNEPRPKRYFSEFFPDVDLPQVIGVHMHSSHSFPSGHTASAFAFFFTLVLLTSNRALQFLYCMLAILVGYSRIYLSQHFANDVLVGAIIGVVMTIVSMYFIDKKSPAWYNYRIGQPKKQD